MAHCVPIVDRGVLPMEYVCVGKCETGSCSVSTVVWRWEAPLGSEVGRHTHLDRADLILSSEHRAAMVESDQWRFRRGNGASGLHRQLRRDSYSLCRRWKDNTRHVQGDAVANVLDGQVVERERPIVRLGSIVPEGTKTGRAVAYCASRDWTCDDLMPKYVTMERSIVPVATAIPAVAFIRLASSAVDQTNAIKMPPIIETAIPKFRTFIVLTSLPVAA